MLKVTLKLSFYCVIIFCGGCKEADTGGPALEIQRVADSLSEARIDSAYAAIKSHCDTMMVYQVPQMVDSLLKDSALLQTFFDTGKLYFDANKKVEKIVRQLQADCDASLQKETYRRARLKQKLKPKQRLKLKA